MLNDALAGQNWMAVAAISAVMVLMLVSIVLKALGKGVPVLDTLVSMGKGLVKVLPKKAPPPPADPAKDGVAAVVPVEEKKP